MSSHGSHSTPTGFSLFSDGGYLDDRLAPIERYWWSACENGCLPVHGDLDPRKLSGFLEYTLLMKRLGRSEARINVAGRHLSDAMGLELTGLPISLFFTHESRALLADVTREMFEHGKSVLLETKFDQGMFRGDGQAQVLMLPLLDQSGTVSRVLGGVAMSSSTSKAPRFDICSSTTRVVDLSRPDPKPNSRVTQNGRHVLELVVSK